MSSALAATRARWLAKPLLVLAVAALAACVSINDGYVPRGLDAQTVRQYDELFFNEVDDPLNPSNRYGADWKSARKRDFERMAAAGYAPAITFLRVWDMDQRARKDFSPEPFEMLKQRALSGDMSAACALWPVWSWGGQRERPAREVYLEFRPFIEAGVKAGHFACQYQAASRSSVLSGALMPLSNEELKLLLQSATQGYYRAHWVLALRLRQLEPLSQSLINQTLCWSAVADLKRAYPMHYHTARTALQLRLTSKGARAQTLLEDMQFKWPEYKPSALVSLPSSTIDQCLQLHGQ